LFYIYFNPWQWVKALANVSRLLFDNNLFILDEAGRVYSILMRAGFKGVLAEVSGEKGDTKHFLRA
jgi:hypothetical protein